MTAHRIAQTLDLDHPPVGTTVAWALFLLAAVLLTWCS